MTDVSLNTDTVSLSGLTKTDIAALRKADDVYAVLYEGQFKLRCVKRATWVDRERDPFAQDVRIDIPVEGRVVNYEHGDGPERYRPVTDYQGFASLYGSTGVWEILRPGDRISLDFTRGNYSEWLRENAPNTAVDHVSIYVTHTTPAGRSKQLRFQGAYQAGAKNSARLIRTREEGWV